VHVVGETTEREVWVASAERRFRVNELLLIEDESLNRPIAEVVESKSFNRFIPLAAESGVVDRSVLESLRRIGYDLSKEEIHVARLRLLSEAPYPVRAGSPVSVPEFDHVRHLLLREEPQSGVVLGTIRSTAELSRTMDAAYRGVALTAADGEPTDEGVPFVFSLSAMQQYPHVGIFGGSGSGKSFCLRVFMEEIMRLSIPALAFDPHFEMDFATPAPSVPEGYAASFSGRYEILHVGRDVGARFEDLGTLDLCNLLSAAGGGLSESMTNAVEALHRRSDSYETFSGRIELLLEALEMGPTAIERALADGSTGGAGRARLEEMRALLGDHRAIPPASVSGLSWRLRRLQREGVFGRDITPVEGALQAGKAVVLRGPIWLLQVFGAYVLGRLYRSRRAYKDARLRGEAADFFPPFVVVTDEAHNFAPKGYDRPASSILREIAQEGRKYGVYLVLATQRPALLDETVVAQLNTKCVFRTVRSSDIATVREETDLTPDETARLPYLRSGDTFVSSALFGRTVSIRVRLARSAPPHADEPFEELHRVRAERRKHLVEALERLLPVMPDRLAEVLVELRRRGIADVSDVQQLVRLLDSLVYRGLLIKKSTPFGDSYDAPPEDRDRAFSGNGRRA